EGLEDASSAGPGPDDATPPDLAQSGTPLGRPYRALWLGTTVSSLGDGLALAGLPLLAATLTASPLLVAGVLTIQSLPWLVLAFPAGVLADRWDRARVMMLANLGQALTMAAVVGLVATHSATIPWLYALAFFLGAFETVYLGAAQAIVPDLVGSPELERANGYLAATETAGAQLIGPAIGGFSFMAQRMIPFAGDCISFLASAGILASLRGRRPSRVTEPLTLREDLARGLAFFRGSSLLRWLAAFTAGLVLTQAIVMGPLVLYVLHELHLHSTGYGLLLSAAAIGNVAGSLVVNRIRMRFEASSVLIGAGLVAALGYLVMAGTVLVASAVVGLMVEALAVACGTVASVSLRQRHIPAELLGRVSNLFRSLIWGAVPLGALIGGLLATSLGLRAPFAVAGAAQVLMVVALARPLHRVASRAKVPEVAVLAQLDVTSADHGNGNGKGTSAPRSNGHPQPATAGRTPVVREG
ncbi:MAG: MFS transporter, partial [Acidimicrobiales bacterium]|nr:MFS transporter [Acidimicrobiales bacterium]